MNNKYEKGYTPVLYKCVAFLISLFIYFLLLLDYNLLAREVR